MQTNGQTMDGDVLTRFRDQAVSPRDNYQELATLGNDMAQLHGRLNQLERQKSYDNNSNMTESIEINGLPTRPPHRNVSLQAGFGDTESRGDADRETLTTGAFPLQGQLWDSDSRREELPPLTPTRRLSLEWVFCVFATGASSEQNGDKTAGQREPSMV